MSGQVSALSGGAERARRRRGERGGTCQPAAGALSAPGESNRLRRKLKWQSPGRGEHPLPGGALCAGAEALLPARGSGLALLRGGCAGLRRWGGGGHRAGGGINGR